MTQHFDRWKLTFEIDIPEYASRTRLIRLMEDAAEDAGCEVQGFVERERVYPPLKLVNKGHGGSE